MVRRFAPAALVLMAASAAVAGCAGGDDTETQPSVTEPSVTEPGMTATSVVEPGAAGRELFSSSGCSSCHGRDGQGGAGPELIGLAGREVTLTGDETVVADDEYLRRAIADPGADRVDGYTIVMPENDLSDSEIDDVITYLKTLEGE